MSVIHEIHWLFTEFIPEGISWKRQLHPAQCKCSVQFTAQVSLVPCIDVCDWCRIATFSQILLSVLMSNGSQWKWSVRPLVSVFLWSDSEQFRRTTLKVISFFPNGLPAMLITFHVHVKTNSLYRQIRIPFSLSRYYSSSIILLKAEVIRK